MSLEESQPRQWPAVMQPFFELAERLERNPPVALLRNSMAVLITVGTLAIGVNHSGETLLAELEAKTELCNELDCNIGKQPAIETITSVDSSVATANSGENTTTLPPQTTQTSSSPSPVVAPTIVQAVEQIQATANKKALSPETQRAVENIEKMQLTREGYVKALESINTDFYNYAQSKPKFTTAEMQRQGIPQNATVFITEHVSASYYNADGTVTDTPVGEASNPQLFIDKIIARNDPRCCAVNQFIDRNAIIYWLAPRGAKLRHNYGYDGQTTGKEMEGHLNQDLTKEELEASAYLDIGNLFVEGLHTKPLEETIRGHAKTRQQYNDAHPENRQPVKIDWQEEVTAAYRHKLAEFMQANPDFTQITPQSFLDLP